MEQSILATLALTIQHNYPVRARVELGNLVKGILVKADQQASDTAIIDFGVPEHNFRIGEFNFCVSATHLLVTLAAEDDDNCWPSGTLVFELNPPAVVFELRPRVEQLLQEKPCVATDPQPWEDWNWIADVSQHLQECVLLTAIHHGYEMVEMPREDALEYLGKLRTKYPSLAYDEEVEELLFEWCVDNNKPASYLEKENQHLSTEEVKASTEEVKALAAGRPWEHN